jgi:hypothetical protein
MQPIQHRRDKGVPRADSARAVRHTVSTTDRWHRTVQGDDPDEVASADAAAAVQCRSSSQSALRLTCSHTQYATHPTRTSQAGPEDGHSLDH